MFGFIKNLIGGIVNFFIGLFGGKKSGYYLELDEAAEVAQDAAKKAATKTKEVAQTVASKTKEAASKTVEAAQSVVSTTEKEVETAAAKEKQAAQPVAAKAEAIQKAEATKNGSKRSAKKAPSATSPADAQPIKVELVQTSNGVRPEPVQPAKAEAAKKVIQEQPTETTFAPKYLIPNNSNGRRRPGANMNSYLDMARQVKPAK
jgi:gas vesicle protein